MYLQNCLTQKLWKKGYSYDTSSAQQSCGKKDIEDLPWHCGPLSYEILSPSKFVYFNASLHCCHGRCHDITYSHPKCSVTCCHNILMIWRYPLNNNNVMIKLISFLNHSKTDSNLFYFAFSWRKIPVNSKYWPKIYKKPSSNLSPYIFTLVHKVKHRLYKIHAFLNDAILFRDCNLVHLKMTCTSCRDEIREKVPSFQKVTLFLRYKP